MQALRVAKLPDGDWFYSGQARRLPNTSFQGWQRGAAHLTHSKAAQLSSEFYRKFYFEVRQVDSPLFDKTLRVHKRA